MSCAVYVNKAQIGTSGNDLYDRCQFMKNYLITKGLLSGIVTIIDGPSNTVITDSKSPETSLSDYCCSCCCHCGLYECDDCYETVSSEASPVVHTKPPCSSSTEEEGENTWKAVMSTSQEEVLLHVWPAETQPEAMDGICLILNSDRDISVVRVKHQEQSYMMFWTQAKVCVEPICTLEFKTVS